MSEEVRTKIPLDTSKTFYARPWQQTQEELVSNSTLSHLNPHT